MLKRGLKGTYVAVSQEPLQRYVDELIFRYNARQYTDGDRFLAAVSKLFGRRLSYKQLVANTGRGVRKMVV